MPRRLNRVIATTTSSVPKCSSRRPAMSLARANIFPCATFQVEKAQHTSRLLQQDLARCYVEFRIPAESRAHVAGSDAQGDYDRLVRLLGVLLPVTFEVKPRYAFSSCRCVCFWFGSGHLKCDTAAILTPRRSSSIRIEFKAKMLTFFFPRLKSNVAVPWWHIGTTELVSGGRPRETRRRIYFVSTMLSRLLLLQQGRWN